MATPLKDRIRSAAIATPALTALLGTNPFRWYDIQLAQTATFPAVTQMVVSGNKTYNIAGRMTNGFSRVQFTLWSDYTPAGSAQLAAVENALITFLDSLNLVGISGLSQYSNLVVSSRDAFYAGTEPGKLQKIIDAMVFSNDNL